MHQYQLSSLKNSPARRLLLSTMGGYLACFASPGFAQGAQPSKSQFETIRLAQLLDSSPEQQEISRDYATGIRLALNDLNKLARRKVQLVQFESDGTVESTRAAVKLISRDSSLCAILGTAGERLAIQSVQLARAEGLSISHLAPWLFDTRFDRDHDVLTLLASREAQIGFALKSLESLGMTEIGLVYIGEQEDSDLVAGAESAARALKLRPMVFSARRSDQYEKIIKRLVAPSPALILFLGGTIELSQFSQRLAANGLQKYLVSLSDINAETLLQLGLVKSVPMILTQVVPNPQISNLPSVLEYRTSLKAQFDEKPSQISLAGYLAAKYVLPTLVRGARSVNREAVLAEFETCPNADIGGFKIGFGNSVRRGSSFVTQSLLTAEGRLVG